MRGKIKACDSCRVKKVKCDGNEPCVYCSNHSITCSFNDIPKKLTPYTKKKKKDPSDSIVGVKTSSVRKAGALENRVSRIESLLESLINKIDNQEIQKHPSINTPISSESSDFAASTISTDYDIDETFACGEDKNDKPSEEQSLVVNCSTSNSLNSAFDSYDNFISGDYFSVSCFSANGLMWAADQLRDPYIVPPLKNLISNFIRLERTLLSVWVDPVDSSRISSLPPRDVIEAYMEAYKGVCILDLLFLDDAKELVFSYCQFRDGLNPQPHLGYGNLLLLNTCLLLGCTLYYERMKFGLPFDHYISNDQGKLYEKQFLDNALYYFHRISVLGDGVSAVEGLILLVYYADIYAVTQPLYSFTSFAVRQAQDLGLHRQEYYEHLNREERNKMLGVWWISYVLDKSSALKTGRPPIVDDESVTAPPLPHLEKYTNSSGKVGLKGALRRDLFHADISKEFKDDCLTSDGSDRNGLLYFVLQIDLATIVSKMYKNVLSQDNSKTTAELFGYAQSLLNDLENWRLCIPQNSRPGLSPAKYMGSVQSKIESVTRFLRVTDMNLDYYYLKLTMSMIAFRNSTDLDQGRYAKQGLDSARRLLKCGMAIGKKYLQLTGFSLFSVFSAFLSISAFCLQVKCCGAVYENVLLLISSCRELFSYFTQTSHFPEKWVMVGAVARCVLYIVVNFVEQNNKDMHFDIGDILDEVAKMQNASSFKHLSFHLQERTHPSRFDNSNFNSNNLTPSSASENADHSNHYSEVAIDLINVITDPKSTEDKTEGENKVSTSTEIDKLLGILEDVLPAGTGFISNGIFGENSPDDTSNNNHFNLGTSKTDNSALGSDYSSSQLDDLFKVD